MEQFLIRYHYDRVDYVEVLMSAESIGHAVEAAADISQIGSGHSIIFCSSAQVIVLRSGIRYVRVLPIPKRLFDNPPLQTDVVKE